MPRYVLDVCYKGSDFFGSQVQPDTRTVQGEIEKSLSIVLRQETKSYFAGRTDSGVHGLHLPAHFDYEKELHPKFLKSLNAVLPKDVSVSRVWKAVKADFNARFDAISREYEYKIIRHKAPLTHGLALHWGRPMNFDLMQEAAAIIPEYKSFECFCKVGGNNKTFLCDIKHSYFEQDGQWWLYRVKADRFLRGMVRAIVGTLIEVGKEKLTLDGFREVIEKKDRSEAGANVPPHGLFLMKVEYPEGYLEPYHLIDEVPHNSLEGTTVKLIDQEQE